jgi:hypothetical protein
MNKIPTAIELTFQKFPNHNGVFVLRNIEEFMIEFAQIHVQEALKAVKTNINVDIDEFGNVTGYDDKMHKSILDSYPPSNIK